MVSNNTKNKRGFSLIEVLVVASLMLIVFGGLLISFRYSLELISNSRAKLSALTVSADTMEYIRSLSYDNVGTISGIPAGPLPQVSTTTLNGFEFTKTILVEYIDDDADGLGASDSNGITTDYKQAKVTISWTIRGVTQSIFLISNITPRSIETDVGGGTLRVNVFDADIASLPGASVRVVNNTVVPNVDVTRTTDASGIALFGGAPAGPDYEIYVTGTGYSTDQTYMATTSIPNPSTLPVAVVEADISTMNFYIDELSDLQINAYSSKVTDKMTENFTDMSGATTSVGLSISGGDLVLSGGAGSYVSEGTLFLNTIAPSPLASWDYLVLSGTLAVNTDVKAQFYTSASSSTLISDADLPGNSTGFSLGNFDISMLDAVTYPSLTIGLTLTTSDANVTPQLDKVVVGYIESMTPLVGNSLTAQGSKVIGTWTDGSPVYKNVLTDTTDSNGQVNFTGVEYDAYTISSGSYVVAEACDSNPVVVDPGVNSSVRLLLVSGTDNTLRVKVQTSLGSAIPEATVKLTKGGTTTKITSGCGQVFFSGLASDSDYTLTISVDGYSDQVFSSFGIDGHVYQAVTF